MQAQEEAEDVLLFIYEADLSDNNTGSDDSELNSENDVQPL